MEKLDQPCDQRVGPTAVSVPIYFCPSRRGSGAGLSVDSGGTDKDVPSNFTSRPHRPGGLSDYAASHGTDVGTLDGTQMGLEQEAFRQFPLNDQEILVRHFHKTVGDWVDAHARAKEGAR